ncbi:purine-nucleoside phosphorylase, partial [Candidatus Roizmanbacteria bacterium CG22_combo_CG10-13_8_21_14_all_33_16]
MFDDAKAFSQLQKKIIDFPETVVVLGSGWNKLLDNVSAEIIIDYDELFGVKTTVPGHKGQLIIASVNKKRVAFMSGRFHMYEGYSAYQSTTPIRVFTKAG